MIRMLMRKQDSYSEPVQEIMGTIPSWTVRWGVTVIAAVFVIIVIGCCFVKYPQTISGGISIISTNPPARLEARYSGIIDTIAVSNGDKVKQGDLIALLKTPAVFGDVMSIKTFAEKAVDNGSLPELVRNPLFETPLELGSLQDKWTGLRSLATEYQLYHNLDQLGKKRSFLSQQYSANNEHYDALLHQRDLIERDTELQLQAMRRDSVLWEKGLTAQAEYEVSQQAYISKLNSLVSADAGLKAAILTRLSLEQGMNELDIQRQEEENEFYLKWSRTVSELLAQIADWVETYAIIAPFDGVVSLQDFWGMGQHVTVGNILASVVPDAEDEVEGRMMVSSDGFGKIELGQTVNVRLNGFPYIEYGILKGAVKKISRVPEKIQDGTVAYNVEVTFPDGLVSTYRQTFPFIQNMDGEAEIVTGNQRLIEHFIDPIISLYRNR